MARQPERLVETIFKHLKAKGDTPRRVSSLFHPSPIPNSRAPEPSNQSSLPPTIQHHGALAQATSGSTIRAQQPLLAGYPAKRFPIGLDLGPASLKWVTIGLVNRQTTIVELGCQPLSQRSTLPETPQDQLREALSRVVIQHHLAGEVVCSLPLEDVNLQLLKMPVLPEAELEQAIRWQIEPTLPSQVSYDDLVVDYVVLQQSTGSLESRVLVASVPRQRVMAMVDLVQSVGLRPIAVEIDPVALTAGLAWAHRFRPDQTALVLHLGTSTASLSVVVWEQLAFSRSLLTTDRSLTQALVDHLGVSGEEAEHLKRTYGLLGTPDASTPSPSVDTADQGSAVARALASPLENLTVELLHAFKSFSHQVTQSQVQHFDQVYLSGEAAQLPGLIPWLEARLQVPVELVNPFSFLPMQESIGSGPSWSQQAPQFAIAIGLALHEVPIR